jgi:NTP pyrophosphatase (non-canonical NTP hydrolase)
MQMGKMVSEVGELCDAIIKDDKNGQIDGIGDVLVTLIILSNQLGYDIEDCLEVAYNEIKNRKGETINGTFIKE